MKRMIPIWLFIGTLLFIYGAVIFAEGLLDFSAEQSSRIAMSSLHLQLWWGIALLVMGSAYVAKFWPIADEMPSVANAHHADKDA